MTQRTQGFGVLVAGAVLGIVLSLGTEAQASRSKGKQSLSATAAAPGASGKATLLVRGGDGRLTLVAKHLLANATYDIILDTVKVGTVTTTGSGKAKARFRSRPRSSKDLLLGIDPFGKLLLLRNASGEDVLVGDLPVAPAGSGSVDDIRCCLPDDSGPECEDRTAAECAAAGGIDMGPGSCLPNPCEGAPAGSDDDIVCCLPDDSGPECEDRTAAECAAQGGVVVAATSCTPNPCAATPPANGDIQCCLPDDSGPECEDRTPETCTAQGGVNMGAGTCTPNPCPTIPGGGGGTPLAVVTCEHRASRSRASVNGKNLAGGNYTARITSGASTAASRPAATVGDEVEFDFDSDSGDIAAGATAIAASFLQGSPTQVTGEVLDGTGAVVASATATCIER